MVAPRPESFAQGHNARGRRQRAQICILFAPPQKGFAQ